jgi:RecJ-like exonuclease
MKIIKCHKCNGTGKIEVFKHIQNGVCFECGGCGKIEVDDDYISISELKIKKEKAEKEYLELHNKYIEYKKRNAWDRKWQFKWDDAQYIQCNILERRKEVLKRIEEFENEFKDIIIKSITDNSIDIFNEIDKLHNKYKFE